MQVIVNRWRGDKPSNWFFCDYCEKYATVVELSRYLYICANCLNKAQKAISAAVLEEVAR